MNAIRNPGANVVDSGVSRPHDAHAPVVPQCERASPVTGYGDTAQPIKSGWGGARPGAGRKPNPTPVRAIQRSPLGPRWHVLQIIQAQASRIMRDLGEGENRKGYPFRPPFRAYLPLQVAEVRIRGKLELMNLPMLPGYVLVQFDREADHWPSLRHVDGVLSILGTRGGIPIPINPGLVEMLIETASSRLKLAPVTMPCIESGATVRIGSGPFEGHKAECVSCDGRVTTVRLSVMGRDVDVLVPRADVGAV